MAITATGNDKATRFYEVKLADQDNIVFAIYWYSRPLAVKMHILFLLDFMV